MVMSLLAACAPTETPQNETPMEDQNPSNNGTNSGNPLDEGPTNDGMDNMNNDPLNEDNQNNKDGSKGLIEEKLAMNNTTEAFKFLDEVLTETNNKGYFEVA